MRKQLEILYCGWGYTARGGTVSILEVVNGPVLGALNARCEWDEDGWVIEWDETGTLPQEFATTPWPPPQGLVLTPLSDEQKDEYYDELRNVLQEVLHD